MMIGLICLPKYKNTYTRYFIYFLIYVLLMSNLGSYPYYFWKYPIFESWYNTIYNSKFRQNYWWFTVFWHIVAVCFFEWYFIKSLKNKTHSKILTYVLIFFIGSSIINIFLKIDNLFIGYYPFISINESVVILFCVSLYFMEILQSDRVLNFYRDVNFYIAGGILAFWLITTPLVFFERYYKDYDMDYVALRIYIYVGINIFMYGMFSLGLIVSNPKLNVQKTS